MKLYDLLQFGVCVFSILAAGFWLRSATTTLPNLTENLRWDGMGPFPDALKSQSRWSAAGAACAGMCGRSITGLNESEALLGIEPFDSSYSHAGLLEIE